MLAVLVVLFSAGVARAAENLGTVFMWKVEKGAATVYLLGSIHALKADAYPLPAAIESAFESAEIAVFEVDVNEMNSAAFELLAAGSLDGQQTLEEIVGAETWAELGEATRKAGLEPGMLQFMKPWMAALSVAALELTAAGYLPAYGLDTHLSERAAEAGKERQALETVDFQVSLFAGLMPEESLAFLRYTLADLETLVPLLDEIYTHWRVGDVGPVEELLGREYSDFPDLFEKFVTDRNHRWMDHLETLLAGERDALVVVGALHLVGDEGLVALLRERGYTVTQL
jgi:uncharacterized protein YbaP (TraB family)